MNVYYGPMPKPRASKGWDQKHGRTLMHQKGEIKTMEEQRCYRPSAIRPRVNLPRPPSHVSMLHIAATQEYMHIDRLVDGSNLDETILRIVHTCRLRSSFPIGPARRDREDLVLSICLLWSPSAWHPSRSCDPKKLPNTGSCGLQHQKQTYILSLTWELLIPDLHKVINNIRSTWVGQDENTEPNLWWGE